MLFIIIIAIMITAIILSVLTETTNMTVEEATFFIIAGIGTISLIMVLVLLWTTYQ